MIGIKAVRRSAIARGVAHILAAGVRATAGRVGYLGSQANLTVINLNDPLPGGWTAHWDTGTLVVAGNNITIDHYRINASLVFTGANPTVTNCEVRPNANDTFGIMLNGGSGVLTVTDTTVVGNAVGPNPQVHGIGSDAGLVVRRCDISRTGDGIHIVAQLNPADALISQCYIHEQAFINEGQHCDGIQVFNNPSTEGFFTVEHTAIRRTTSILGTPMNAALTCGPATLVDLLATPTLNNCYFESGLYHMRVNFRLRDAVITNNDFGPIHASEFGLHVVEEPVIIDSWSNNRDSDGNLLANPYTPVTPVIKEVLQTSDNLTSGQTLSTTGGLTTAGDTLLVVYSTDNNAASLPTSTAGALTQIGTTETNGDGNGLLQIFQVQVATDGSKDVTMPNAGGFDVMGAVLLLDGRVDVEGFVKANFPSTVNTPFSAPTTSLAGTQDLLVAAMFNTQGVNFDVSGSGLTERADPKCLPFAAMTVATEARSAAGATPTYAIAVDQNGVAKPGIAVFGLRG